MAPTFLVGTNRMDFTKIQNRSNAVESSWTGARSRFGVTLKRENRPNTKRTDNDGDVNQTIQLG